MEASKAEEIIEEAEEEQEASSRKQTFYAVVQWFSTDAGGEAEILEAQNRTALRKLIAEKQCADKVMAIFRGHRLEFRKKTDVEFC